MNKLNHLSPVIHVTLISQNHLLHIRARMLLNVPDPVLDVVEALLVGDVVDEHDAHRATVVGRGDRAEPLLPGSVPDLKLDLLSIKLYSSNLEINPYKKSMKSALFCCKYFGLVPKYDYQWIWDHRVTYFDWCIFGNLSQKELTYCGDKSSIEGVLRESEEYAGFSNPRISNEQQFEKVVVSLSHPEAELYLTL